MIIFLGLYTLLMGYSSSTLALTHYDKGYLAYQQSNYLLAKEQLKRSAKEGHAQAQTLLGIMYYKAQGVPQNYHKAHQWWLLSAHQGDRVAQTALGDLYEIGKGVRQDYYEALHWYQLAANQNHAPAQALLGLMYQKGRGVRQDFSKAKEWFGKACDNGAQIGCDEYRKLNIKGY